jgi:hypothetical protein
LAVAVRIYGINKYDDDDDDDDCLLRTLLTYLKNRRCGMLTYSAVLLVLEHCLLRTLLTCLKNRL